MDEPHGDEGLEPAPGAAGEYYLLVCLVMLVLMVVSLNELHLGSRLQAPYVLFGVGVTCLVLRFSSGPPLLFLTMCMLIIAQAGRELPGGSGGVASAFPFILCGSAMAFTIAYYRRLGIESGIFPPEVGRAATARPWYRLPKPQRLCRASSLASPAEILTLVFSLPLYCGAGYMLWNLLDRSMPPPRVASGSTGAGEWHLLLVCWALAVTGTLGAVIWAYLERAGATGTESLLYLQDQVWSETMSEQGRMHRLLVRARLRGRTRKEKP